MTTLLLATGNAHKVAEIRAILGEGFRYLTLNDFPGAPKTVEDAATFAGNATKKAVELANWLSRISWSEFQKAKAISNFDSGNFFVLADDSGLEVDALHGAPGIYSARFAAAIVAAPCESADALIQFEKSSAPSRDTVAGNFSDAAPGNSSDAENKEKLLRLLEKVPAEKRTARFRCAIALTPAVARAQENNSPVCFVNETELRAEIFEGVCEGRIAFAESGRGGFGYDSLFVPDGWQKSFAELGGAEKNKISHRGRALEKLRAGLRG